MKFLKTLLPLTLCLVLVLGFLPTTASAATGGACGDNLYWSLDSAGTLTFSGTGPMTDYQDISQVPWYDYSDDIVNIIIPAGATWICDGYLNGNSLEGIWVDSGNQHYSSDSRGVLFNKNKTALILAPHLLSGSYTIPSGVTTLQDGSLAYCRISSLTIPNSVTTIGFRALFSCQLLEEINIPASVTTIDYDAFGNCHSLTGIWVDPANPNYSSDSYGVLFNKNKDTLIYAHADLTGTYPVPDTVTVIGPVSFYNCWYLEGVVIPPSVTTIEYAAFWYCQSLTTITGGKGLTTIKQYAFSDCTALTDIYYDGTMNQAAAILIEDGNESLANATIHFKASVPGDMDGDGDRDTEDAVYLLLNVLFGDDKYPLAV